MNGNLVEHAKRLMTNFGASWVMWLLLGLSVISVAVMLERGWFYYSLRDDLGRSGAHLRRLSAPRRGQRSEEAPREFTVRRSGGGHGWPRRSGARP